MHKLEKKNETKKSKERVHPIVVSQKEEGTHSAAPALRGLLLFTNFLCYGGNPSRSHSRAEKERTTDQSKSLAPTSVHIYTRSIYVRFPVKHRLKSKQTPSPVLFSFVASLPRARRPARNPRRYTDTSSSSSLLFFFRNLHCTGYARFECIQYETPT